MTIKYKYIALFKTITGIIFFTLCGFAMVKIYSFFR